MKFVEKLGTGELSVQDNKVFVCLLLSLPFSPPLSFSLSVSLPLFLSTSLMVILCHTLISIGGR